MATEIYDDDGDPILAIEGREVYLHEHWSRYTVNSGKPILIIDGTDIYLKKDWARYTVCGNPIAIVRGNKVWSYDDRNGDPIARIDRKGKVWRHADRNDWSANPIATADDEEVMSGAAAAVFLLLMDGEAESQLVELEGDASNDKDDSEAVDGDSSDDDEPQVDDSNTDSDDSSSSYSSISWSSSSESSSSQRYRAAPSSSGSSGGLWGIIIVIVIGLAIWSNWSQVWTPARTPTLSRTSAPVLATTPVPARSVEIVGDNSAGAMVSMMGAMLGKETPSQIIDHRACPHEGCEYGATWMAIADTDAFEAPPRMLGAPRSSLQSAMVIRKGSWVTTVTGQVIAARHTGRVDFASFRPSYRKDMGNGPSLKDGQAVAIYTYLGEGCYTSWIDGSAYVVCGLVGGEPTQEWWVQIATADGAKAWVNSEAFSSESGKQQTKSASIPPADASSEVGEVTDEVALSDTPQLTSAQETKRMSDMLNRATSPNIDLSRNALVFEQAPADHLEKPVQSKHVKPVYPEIALRQHREGEVVIEATIGADGSVHDARVLRARDDMFDGAALWAVSRWTYIPARLNGEAVSVKMTAAVKFSIKPKEQ